MPAGGPDAVTALVLPKITALLKGPVLPVDACNWSLAVCAARNVVFHAPHVFCAAGRDSQSSVARGKCCNAMTLVNVIARIASSDIGRFLRGSLCLASLSSLMYSGIPFVLA